MLRLWKMMSVAALLAAGITTNALADEVKTAKKISSADQWGLKPSGVELKSIGPMAFGPDGVLIVSDPQAATLYAISTEDAGGDPGKAAYNIADVAKAIGRHTRRFGRSDHDQGTDRQSRNGQPFPRRHVGR